ncbi:MAG: serine/threonine protein phosphatase [Leptospira sp.]|nr:MAG: serine/threonine protein phosphatase [Leptospira sp.]
MDFMSLSSENILFNYFSFGSLLVSIIILLIGTFFLSLKDKTKSTFHLGIACILLGIFNFGYFLGAFLYHPIGAYHRWITGGLILPAIIHFGQFLLRWPNNENKRRALTLLIVEYAITTIVLILFVYSTLNSEYKYHFTAHHWDFNAEDASKYLGIMIGLFSLINFVIFPGWRMIFKLTGRNRILHLAYVLSFLVATIVPATFNVLSRDGAMERATYLTSLVLCFYFAFFLITIIFINTSTEKTTFMIKIVGISLVTVMLIFEQLGFIYNQEKEDSYDKISISRIQKILSDVNSKNSASYIIRYSLDDNKLSFPKYTNDMNLDLPMIQTDMENSRIFEEIKKLDSSNFRNNIQAIIGNTSREFEGYKLSILNYLKENKDLSDADLKESMTSYFVKLNQATFVASNKIGDYDVPTFCEKAEKYISTTKGLEFFQEAIHHQLTNCNWNGQAITPVELRDKVLQYFRYFKSAETRHYRKNTENTAHYVAFMVYNDKQKLMEEVGFPYIDYRKDMNRTAVKEMGLMFVALFVLLVLFPLFFKISLGTPLNELLSGVEKVNEGDLEAKVPIHVRDEIGFLADSFNKMVTSIKEARRQLEDYAENLEVKVQERTKEVQEKMEEVQNLKIQQDGDYFLTSLLAKPLYYNANKSSTVVTDFFVHQKKQFEFRKKTGDLGGDISVTGNLKLGKPDNFRRYTVAVNGDAMGKSMQGAGGSLVMGVVMNSIMARSAGNKRILNRTPEEWLADVYEECNSVFKSFNGTMVISAVIFLIDDLTGECWYFNAEHPFTVLYRDGKASFIEKELLLRKLGLDSEIPFEVKKFQLQPGDTLILGTDGRDDIDLTPDEEFRTINEDENIFLKHVEEAKADIYEIERILQSKGELTDDLSIMRLDFKAPGSSGSSISSSASSYDSGFDALDDTGNADDTFMPSEDEEWDKKYTTEGAYEEGRKLYKSGDIDDAIRIMYKAYSVDSNDPKLNKLLSLLSFKGRDYEKAVDVLGVYLKQDPDAGEFWYYLSAAQKKLGEFQKALDAGLKSYETMNDFLSNLINIADLYRLLGNIEESKKYAYLAQEKDPDNKNVIKLFQLLEKNV